MSKLAKQIDTLWLKQVHAQAIFKSKKLKY